VEPTNIFYPIVVEAMRLGADEIDHEYKDHTEWVYAMRQGSGFSIAQFETSTPEARELRTELYRLAKKRKEVVAFGAAQFELRTKMVESFGEDEFRIKLVPVRAGGIAAAPVPEKPRKKRAGSQ
jgi:hypothetical protein